MFCSRCGGENTEQSTICIKCGLPINQSSSANEKPKAEKPEYAGFWLRLAAHIIDGFILGIGLQVYGLLCGAVTWGGEMQDWFVVLSVIVGWAYCTVLESSETQGTLGKMAVGIKVTDLNGEKISFGHANGRYFSKFVSGFTLGIGYIMAGFTEKKQALHDMIADTLVVKK